MALWPMMDGADGVLPPHTLQDGEAQSLPGTG